MNTLALLALGWLLALAAAAQRFAAMTTPAATLSPRYYQAALPAHDKRQVQCKSGQHPYIGSLGEGFCCPDDTYCIVNPSDAGKASCCAIGSVCDGPCPEDQFQCNQTETLTTGSSTSTSVREACCPRPCTATSMFLCPSAMGGGCCSYGEACASSGRCLDSGTAGSSTATATAQPTAPGCTTGQIACPASAGGGCCAATQRCTLAGGSAQCAHPTAPTASGLSAVPRPGDGLSGGAKGGIAVAVIVASGFAIGVATWLFIRRRRRGQEGGGRGRNGGDGSGWSGSGPGISMSGRAGGRVSPAVAVARQAGGNTPYYGGGEMSESHSDVVSRGGRLRGLTQDYFGPDAVPGPFTEETTPAAAVTPAESAGLATRNRAVPAEPQGPDDITAPVEIDSSRVGGAAAEGGDAGERSAVPPVPVIFSEPQRETPEGRFELYGSEAPAAAVADSNDIGGGTAEGSGRGTG